MANDNHPVPSPPGVPAQPPTSPQAVNGPLPASLAKASRAKALPTEPKDAWREIVETVVFVVVLVLLLKTFAAEAFVIPTGSMAETLWGYQKVVACPECGYHFPVNCSGEVEERPPREVTGCVCPNCRYEIHFTLLFEGVLDQVLNNVLVFRTLQGRDVREVQFVVSPDAKVTLDGRTVSPDELKKGMRVRLLSEPNDTALDVEAVTAGGFSRKLTPFQPSCRTGDRVLVAKFL